VLVASLIAPLEALAEIVVEVVTSTCAWMSK